MTVLVIGTAGSGKSVIAEDLAVKTEDAGKIYLATMKILDDDGKQRVIKHKSQREGKGFTTIEEESDISGILTKIDDPENTTVLLECVSNLVGNRMHDNAPHCRKTSEEIFEDIRHLMDRVHNMIIVTNDYSSENEEYDEETRMYIKLLDEVNEKLTACVDRIVDVRDGREN